MRFIRILHLHSSLTRCKINGGIFLETKPDANQILHNINAQFLARHRTTSKASLHAVSAILIFKNGELSLWKKTEGDHVCEASQVIAGEKYHVLKNIAHIPVLLKTIREVDSTEAKNEIRNLRDALHDVLMNSSDISDEDYPEQLIVLKTAEGFLSWALSTENISDDWEEELQNSLGQMQNALDHLCKRAAEVQLEQLDKTVEVWLKQYAVDLATSRVLIVGSHGARNQLIEKQYFLRLYRDLAGVPHAENKNVFYVEVLASQLPRMDSRSVLINEFLAAAELNKSYGAVVKNGNQKTMFSDVTGKQGSVVVTGIFKEKKTKCPLQKLFSTVENRMR